MKAILFLQSLFIMIPLSFAQIQADEITYLETVEKQLDEVYQNLISENQSEKIFVKNLKAAQQAWLQYRDLQFSLFFPNHKPIEKKNLLTCEELKFLSDLTENRTMELLNLLNDLSGRIEYVSDLEIIRYDKIHYGIGLDKPYWSKDLIICGKKYNKGIVIHPEDYGKVAYVEFRIPKEGGQLLGVAGYCEGNGNAPYNRKMRFRIFVDNQVIYGNELIGKECRGINLSLGKGKILRIETDDGGDRNFSDHMAFGDLRIVYDQSFRISNYK